MLLLMVIFHYCFSWHLQNRLHFQRIYSGQNSALQWRNYLSLAYIKALWVAEPQGNSEIGSGNATVKWAQKFRPLPGSKASSGPFLKGFENEVENVHGLERGLILISMCRIFLFRRELKTWLDL